MNSTIHVACDTRLRKLACRLAENRGTSVSEYVRNLIEMEVELSCWDLEEEDYED